MEQAGVVTPEVLDSFWRGVATVGAPSVIAVMLVFFLGRALVEWVKKGKS